ncbi:hypothetical protein G4B88_024030 [Cannabis sativa]|uniref:Pyrrolidone-carboxylate peptidase n=1 Tax=Cannabis sativa TaxID=3483 RepID=A0A7J6ELS9_CANSA|nr:hypothetical protein G4B88_008452 [Cannabis sativa]KAF4359363.1 hypothetical protein G4B88_024030 [Cannabis sativa]
MGSEGPPAVTIHVTGFKKFHGVPENPTETIVTGIKDYLKKNGFPKGLILGSCSILDTAGEGALDSLNKTLQSSITAKDSETSNPGRVVWLLYSSHIYLVVSQKVPIIPEDGAISNKRETSVPVEELTSALVSKGYEVMTSDDAGRFVCNYVYYHSLRFSEQNKTKSLFVHVPLFSTINEETQMRFAASLLEVLATLY